jgi:Helix-turn-helix domain/RodZ C-terminal domain
MEVLDFPQVRGAARVFEIGASLREARETRGLSLDDVQKALCFRVRYLTALEEERWDQLPGGDAYVKGFLRTYAEFLGLNGTLYIDEFNERIATQDEEPIVPESLAPRRGGSSLLTRTIVGVFVLAFVVFAATAWRPGSSPRPTVEAASAATPETKFVPLDMPVAPVIVAKQVKHAKPQPKTATIRVARSTSWFSVRVGGPAGKEIFRGFLARGETLRYRLDRKVWLRIGRPSAVVVTIGKRPVRGLPGTPANLLLTNAGPLAG